MSGIEVAGIVLAVLPIAVSATKACSEGVDDSKKLFRTKHHDEIKRDLFDNLYMELALFNRHMRKTLQALPNISERRCMQALNDLKQHDWQLQPDVVQALRLHLDHDFDSFEYAISQICHWLNKILTYQHLSAQVIAEDPTVFLTNLKAFTTASDARATESQFKDRLHVWRKEGKLKQEVKNLRRWREFLEKVTENAGRRDNTALLKTGTKTTPRPSRIISQMSKELHDVLATSFGCEPNCLGTHSAKICLRGETDLHRRVDGDSLRYNLLLSSPPSTSAVTDEQWLETTINVNILPKRAKVGFSHPGVPLGQVKSICSAMSKCSQRQGAKLRFTVEHFEQEAASEIYQARNYLKSCFEFKPTTPEVKLDHILVDITQRLDLTQRRKLALELSYGMMTFSGSPWLQDRWSKEHISFFHTHKNDLCYAQPLVSSDMIQHCQSQHQQLPLDIMHPLPSVLSLGILLLELETGQTIESMRADEDFVDPDNPVADNNTDFTAAIREAENRSMLSPQYKEAVLACLDEQEWDVGQSVVPSVLQEQIREKLYDQVIYKLESDLDALTA